MLILFMLHIISYISALVLSGFLSMSKNNTTRSVSTPGLNTPLELGKINPFIASELYWVYF